MLTLTGGWSCQKEQPSPARDAQSASQAQTTAPSSSATQSESGHMMQPGAGNTTQPGSDNMMGSPSGHMMQAGSGGTMMQDLRSGCPLAIEGTKVEVTDTADGVALVFTTETGDVADLRQRVEHMAGMYESYCHGRGQMMWHQMGGHGQRNMMGQSGTGSMGPMPAATATVEAVDKGARLVLSASDKSQLDALRTRARQHQQRMRSGECWMLQQDESEQKPTN